MYRVMISDVARRKIKKLDRPVKNAVNDKVGELQKNWPDVVGWDPLFGAGKGHFRVKVRQYRIIFHVDEEGAIIYIDDVDHRSHVYDKFHYY